MDKLATLFGMICAATNGMLVSLSIIHAALVCISFAMMEIDKNPECTWNCGVLIFSAESVALLLVSVPFYLLAKFSLWTNPIKLLTWQMSAAFAFLTSACLYGYAFLNHNQSCNLVH